jgi:hypothetical protein
MPRNSRIGRYSRKRLSMRAEAPSGKNGTDGNVEARLV